MTDMDKTDDSQIGTVSERWESLLPFLKSLSPDELEAMRLQFYTGAWAMFTLVLDWFNLQSADEAEQAVNRWRDDFMQNAPSNLRKHAREHLL